jgi:hypothetical protein
MSITASLLQASAATPASPPDILCINSSNKYNGPTPLPGGYFKQKLFVALHSIVYKRSGTSLSHGMYALGS